MTARLLRSLEAEMELVEGSLTSVRNMAMVLGSFIWVVALTEDSHSAQISTGGLTVKFTEAKRTARVFLWECVDEFDVYVPPLR